MVFDESRDLRDVLSRLGHFFAHESCGKCYPCQLGTQRQKEVLGRVAEGKALPGDVERLQDVGWTMIDASLCGLGQTAATAVLSAIRLWPELFEAPKPRAKKAAVGKTGSRGKLPRARKTGARKHAVTSKKPRRSG
jgi:NADH-quinone oxidoreductase subunit F